MTRNHRSTRALTVLASIASAWACSSSTKPATSTPLTPTYFHDVQPIIQAKCAGCHTEQGIGPFALETADEVVAQKTLIRAAVASKIMPPWPPTSSCGTYTNDRSLTDAQIKTITDWVDGGAPMGDVATQVTG